MEDVEEEETAPQPSTDWSVRKIMVSGWWAKVRPELVNNIVTKLYVLSTQIP